MQLQSSFFPNRLDEKCVVLAHLDATWIVFIIIIIIIIFPPIDQMNSA
jgi:hypothetical protein